MPANKLKTFALTGGEDKVTSPLEIPDGMLRSAYNYEQGYNTGYTRINGYRKLVNDTTPGEGAILGTVVYNDLIYIFRNKTGGFISGMWVATPAVYDDTVSPATIVSNGSWTEITDIKDSDGFAIDLEPDGYYEFVIHNFQATAKDFGNYVGDWTALTNYTEGDIINDSGGALGTAGLKYIAEAAHKSSSSLLTDAEFWHELYWSADVNNSPAHDISGNIGLLYGVDGKNPAFDFDGTTLKQIDSTYANDTPQHIEANGNRLALGFRSGEIAISVLGFPRDFDPVYGAGSIGVTDFLTGMTSGPDGVMYIFTKNKVYLLYGMQGPLDESELKKHSKDVGSYPFSINQLGGHTLFFDVYGITDLQATDVFGDVITNSISKNIQSLLIGQQPVSSVVLKNKAQYRLYFQSTTGADSTTTCIMTTLIQGEELGLTHAVYPFNVATSASGEVGLVEVNIAGSDDGEVFHMDAGTSFNGDEYLSYITLPFNYIGSPNRIKKFKKIRFNVDTPSVVVFYGQADFSFGNSEKPSDIIEASAAGGGSLWGDGTWGEFTWGGGIYSFVDGYFNGHGENISVSLQTTSALDKPHTLKDVTFVYEHMRIEH